MSEHITAAIADCEAKIQQLTDVVKTLRWFVQEFPQTAAAATKQKGKAAKRKPTDRPTDRPTEQRARQREPRSLPDVLTRPRLDLVPARDASILAALKKGPRSSAALIGVLPNEPGQAPEQRESAVRNALTRLKVKKQIVQVDEGWALA